MPALITDLRNDLGRAIVKARQVAEAGAQKALESLAVGRHEPHGSMSPDERALRNRLRARGRQLSDVRDKLRGTQSIDHLTHEVAYEHWHRVLFARFLAENNLLVHPEHGVAVSLDEVDELAREAGEDPHAMAARFAQDSLPQIFRSDDPVLEVALAPESRQALDKLLDALSAAVFTADDSLGWTYQYWQTEKKNQVNESGNKISADELPAVTQLFTEHYMVLFLYHNTIGAWHAGKVLAENPSFAETAQSEQELREAVALSNDAGSSPFSYLRFVRDKLEGDEEDNPTGPWRPAAGVFEGWPKTAKELKILDPCCGSGHFLVVGFKLLVRLRIYEEGLSVEEAIRAVLTDNLYGLELDPRCTQIAAFNLAMAAWKLVGKQIELPPLHIACSGLALGSTKSEWADLARDNDRLRNGMERLYELFEQAPELGSLIDPKALKGDLLVADFTELRAMLAQALTQVEDGVEDAERTVAAQGMAGAAELLAGEYTLVITNVPYLGRGQQNEFLKELADTRYKESKADLATMFVERMLENVASGGACAAVTPSGWLFMGSYERLRQKLLACREWYFVARLGPHAFNTISGEIVNVSLVSIAKEPPRQPANFLGIDTSAGENAREKATLLMGSEDSESIQTRGRLFSQYDQLKNPDSRIIFENFVASELLSQYADSYIGMHMGDNDRFVRRYWENPRPCDDFCFYQSSGRTTDFFCGRDSIAYWLDGGAIHQANPKARVQGQPAWGKDAVSIRLVGLLPASLGTGEVFEQSVAHIVPKSPAHLPAIWAFCSDAEFNQSVRLLDQALKVTNATLTKVPFDLAHWQGVAAEKYPNGLPQPQSDDPTQWLFHGHPAKANPATVLQIAVGRLLGYRWPPELDSEMRLADEARDWVARCGGLNECTDEDGIVCLSATRGEGFAADRLRELLSAAFGSDWSAAKERELLAVTGDRKKPATSLDVWLRDKFFEEHCKLFHHRPFVWHIWDGNRDGFHCLVNAHKLTGPEGEGRRTLKAIAYSYLGDWIDRQKANQQEGKGGSDARTAAAQDLQGQLEKILEGEPPYDIFVRWKPLHEQAIGWEPDINDGVRLNIRPFMNAELRVGGKKGAGILRWKPNIKWEKDRGKELQSLPPKTDFPWFWSCGGDGNKSDCTDFPGGNDFDGNRWNDLHYTRETKEKAFGSVAANEGEGART